MNYEKFLGKKEEAVLAYLGGSHVEADGRRLRIEAPRPEVGFHHFTIVGRSARANERVPSPDLDRLPRVRGHHVRGWLVGTQGPARVERVQLMPAEEPPPLAIVRARRWYSSDLVFETLDFDGEAEEEARLRLEQRLPLGPMKGVPATLRVAYGIALLLGVADRMKVALSVREAAGNAPRACDLGEAEATTIISAIARRRDEEADRARIRAIAFGARPSLPVAAVRARHREVPTLDNASIRAEVALDGARARMLSSRHLGDGNLEVTFEFMGERFISVVDGLTLHVYDSGVCLAGADELVTLDSLPGVIREAIETDALVITRR
jgi:hypothetical protein